MSQSQGKIGKLGRSRVFCVLDSKNRVLINLTNVRFEMRRHTGRRRDPIMKAKPASRPPRKGIILREAARLFREKGYRASTLRELARRSGVKGGSIYYHFASKQEILYRIMDETMDSLLQGLEREIRKEADPVRRLGKGIEFHIRYHLEKQDETHVADTELINLEDEHRRRILGMRAEYERTFSGILEEGNRAGVMDVGNIKLASIAILQMCTGIPYWFNEEGPLTVDEVVTQYTDFIFRGVLGRVGVRGGASEGECASEGEGVK
jgi:AcrR family transcriptional regulator